MTEIYKRNFYHFSKISFRFRHNSKEFAVKEEQRNILCQQSTVVMNAKIKEAAKLSEKRIIRSTVVNNFEDCDTIQVIKVINLGNKRNSARYH